MTNQVTNPKIVDAEIHPDKRGYMGNHHLKRRDAAIDFTPEQIAEYTKCYNDPIYFSERYVKIVHVDDGLIDIKLYDYQKDIINSSTNNRRTAVVASRQCGKTTTAVCLILHYILFNKYKSVGLLANKGDSAREILDRIKLAYESLPMWLQQGIVEWNKGFIELENGCKVLAGSTSSSSIRGKSMSYLYIDETAFVEGWDEFFASVFPTITSGKTTKILFTSTPNGLNHFYKTCVGAKKGTNGYSLIEVTWDKVPGRDEEWRRETLSGLDDDLEKFEVEFNCQFTGSSGTLISGQGLKNLVEERPMRKDENVSVYREPEAGHNYSIICDVSRGKGLDFSAFQIIDITAMPYHQVATFRDNLLPPVEYAEVIHRLAKYYNEASVLVEINDIGGQVSDMLYYDYGYENILFTENAGAAGKRISLGFGTGKADRGIRTTRTVKNTGCSILKLLIEQQKLIINDIQTITELKRFSRKGNSYEAESGCNDDLVMCLVLFAWLSDQRYFKDLTNINTMMELRERTQSQMEQNLTPFGLIVNGHEDEELELGGGWTLADDWTL